MGLRILGVVVYIFLVIHMLTTFSIAYITFKLTDGDNTSSDKIFIVVVLVIFLGVLWPLSKASLGFVNFLKDENKDTRRALVPTLSSLSVYNIIIALSLGGFSFMFSSTIWWPILVLVTLLSITCFWNAYIIRITKAYIEEKELEEVLNVTSNDVDMADVNKDKKNLTDL